MKKSSNKKLTTPTSIKTIIVINYIIAFFLLLLGISLISSSAEINSNPDKATTQFLETVKSYPSIKMTAEEARDYVLMVARVAPYIAAIVLILAAIHILLGIYIKKRKAWAKMTQVIIAILAIIYALLMVGSGNILFGIVLLLIEGWIASYLLFTIEGKTAFS